MISPYLSRRAQARKEPPWSHGSQETLLWFYRLCGIQSGGNLAYVMRPWRINGERLPFCLFYFTKLHTGFSTWKLADSATKAYLWQIYNQTNFERSTFNEPKVTFNTTRPQVQATGTCCPYTSISHRVPNVTPFALQPTIFEFQHFLTSTQNDLKWSWTQGQIKVLVRHMCN